jgi:atypical dual specificity phosphatase
VALTAVATHIEDHYQRATDVELLITHNADGTSIVHVVQARPINRPATLANPSYVTNLAAVAPENIVSAQTVVAAGSSVRHITAQNQLIVAPTLAIALTHYLTPEFDKAAVLAVAVQAEAEPNSHEATTFASEGKLVMVARDYEKVTAWHTAPALSISLDPQQGLIINPGDTTLTVADGYTTHPIPAHVSIDATATTVALPFAIADCLPATETPALVTLLKQGTIIEAQQALASLLARINRQVETVHHDLVCSVAPAFCTDAQAKLAALERFARQKAVVILPLLVLEGNDLQRLATVKPLEALLVQEEDPALVDTYSVAGVVKEFIARKTFVEHHPLLSPALLANFQFLDMAHAGCTVAMTPELETKWLTFVGETAAAPAAQQQQLTNLWQTLEHFKLTSLWINTLFNAATGDATTMLVQLHTAVVTAQKALAHLDTLRQDIGKLPPAAWSDPEKYATNLTTLRELVAQFTSPEFIVHLTSDNNLAIAAALSTMDSFVDTFDRSIKALKASSIDHKVEHFKELLDTYYALLQAWAPNAQAYITFCEAWWLLDEYQNPLDQYLGSLKKALAKFSNGEGQLLPSPAFSVSAAMLGSSTVFERHSPNTAEDAFTLIHQNLLVVMGALTNHHFAPLIIKPQLFRNLETALFKLPRMQLISINYTNTILQAHYNLPIQHHSAVFDIIYDKITNTTQLITRFVGLRFRRWDTIEAHALLDADAHLLPSKTDLGAQEVSITYAFQSDQYFEQLVTTLSLFIDIANEDRSFVSPPNSDPIQLLTQLYKASPYNGMLFEIGRSALVKYGPVVQKIIDDVVASATLVIPNGNAHIQCAVMDFFGALVKNNYTSAFAAATTAATTEMASSDWDIRILAKQLFETLFQHLIDHINLSLLTINGIKLNIGGMARPTQPWQIRVLQHFDYKLVVSLTEDPLDPTLFEGATIKNIHLPIASGAAPTPEQVARFLHEAQQTIASGGKVIVHCNQGFNRTGTMLTLWLMAHEGMTAEDAIKLVREQRPGSISFRAQENFLRAWVR